MEELQRELTEAINNAVEINERLKNLPNLVGCQVCGRAFDAKFSFCPRHGVKLLPVQHLKGDWHVDTYFTQDPLRQIQND